MLTISPTAATTIASLIVNRLGSDEPLDGPEYHQRHHRQEQDGTGEASKDFDLPRPEREPRVGGVSTGGGVGEGAQSDGKRVRTHVKAVGKQRHRVVPPARDDLDNHHDGGQPRDRSRPPLTGGIAAVEDVVVLPVGDVAVVAWQFLEYVAHTVTRCVSYRQDAPKRIHVETDYIDIVIQRPLCGETTP